MKWNKGSGGGDFEKPALGWATGVLAAIYDLGVQDQGGKYGPKHQVCLWWELNARDSEGKQFGLRDVCTLSLFEGAHLSARVAALLGRELSEDERDDFDPKTLLGQRAKLLLAVSPKNPNGNPFVKMAGPVEASDPEILPEFDYASAVPRFVESIVGDDVAGVMLAEIRAGGGDSANAWQGENPRQPQTTQNAPSAPAASPPPAAPDALPEGWTAHVDPQSGKTYYAGPGNVTTWDKPAPAPSKSAEAPPVPGGDGTPF